MLLAWLHHGIMRNSVALTATNIFFVLFQPSNTAAAAHTHERVARYNNSCVYLPPSIADYDAILHVSVNVENILLFDGMKVKKSHPFEKMERDYYDG